MNALEFTFKASIGVAVATAITKLAFHLFPVLTWKYEKPMMYGWLVLIVVSWLVIGHFWA